MSVILSEVIRLAARGEGVTADGRHVALAAPGDMVDNAAEIVPGPHHVDPPCRHFPRCGGCQLQHVDDEAYSTYLRERIESALAAQRLSAPDIRIPHLSPAKTRRRASLRAERIGKRIVVGFNEAASHYIVDIRECPILLPQLFALIDPLRTLLGSLLAPRKTATIFLAWADQGADVALDDVAVEGLAAQEALIEFAQAQNLARLSIDEGFGSEARWEPEPVTVTIDGVAVGFPAKGFLQATADGASALTGAVVDAIGDAADVADLFAGIGTFALPLADKARVLAVEGARDPALALR
ncbi:MAG TPA: class I SAM-dependent RNA methyltransferase, partial [Sphingomonas sp.]|nr:class I SAM-dependent RNA methyltransferase [Sphingomonas sp.]